MFAPLPATQPLTAHNCDSSAVCADSHSYAPPSHLPAMASSVSSHHSTPPSRYNSSRLDIATPCGALACCNAACYHKQFSADSSSHGQDCIRPVSKALPAHLISRHPLCNLLIFVNTPLSPSPSPRGRVLRTVGSKHTTIYSPLQAGSMFGKQVGHGLSQGQLANIFLWY